MYIVLLASRSIHSLGNPSFCCSSVPTLVIILYHLVTVQALFALITPAPDPLLPP
jgi:hypothetical protein